jgi:hypothetical protein
MKRRAGLVLAAISALSLGIGVPSAGAWDGGHDHHESNSSMQHDHDGNQYRRDSNDGWRKSDYRRFFLQSLNPVPHDSMVSGHPHTNARTALVKVGPYVAAFVHVRDSAPGLVHAQHIHGVGMHACPSIGRDVNRDGLIDTSEGALDYGGIVTSLTKSGDATPASGLAVDRFPVADSHGEYSYGRLLRIGTDIPADVAAHLDRYHIVVHGIDTNHNGAYDFSRGPSDLDPALPQEATVPAACGLIH